MKTEVYNLIILDESGSMSGVTRQTIDGCNETINTIQASQQQFADTQRHYISIYVFQSNPRVPSRYIIKNLPAEQAHHIKPDQYIPWGSTPLYDAVGSTLVDLKAVVATSQDAIGSVTIITDGAENASTQYTRGMVAKMIEALKEEGWQFSFIGANIDVARYARDLNIDNMMKFDNDEAGTAEMFAKERDARLKYNSRLSEMSLTMPRCASYDDVKAARRKAASKYFDSDDQEA